VTQYTGRNPKSKSLAFTIFYINNQIFHSKGIQRRKTAVFAPENLISSSPIELKTVLFCSLNLTSVPVAAYLFPRKIKKS